MEVLRLKHKASKTFVTTAPLELLPEHVLRLLCQELGSRKARVTSGFSFPLSCPPYVTPSRSTHVTRECDQ